MIPVQVDGEVDGVSTDDPVAPEATAAVPAPRVRPARSVTIAGHAYPVVLPNPRDSRLHVAAVTLTVHLLGQLGLDFQLSVPQILAAILSCAVVEAAITFRTKRSIVWPASAMLTGSGVALILRLPGTPMGDHWSFHGVWVYAAVAVGSLLTKYLIRYKGSPIFNPSNVGLVAVFAVFGTTRVEPLDFWWSPLDGWMIAAYLVIIVGGAVVTARLNMLRGALAFWATVAAGTALVAGFGHCITARWAFAPVCGFDYWRTIVTSPEVLIFMFFMITDPRTVPRGRVGHVSFSVLVGIASVLLMAPQSTEFWSKVGLLGGLTVMCALRPLIERWFPERDSADDRIGRFATWLATGRRDGASTGSRIAHIGLTAAALIAVPVGVVAAAVPARGTPVPDLTHVINRVPHHVDPSTMPAITVDQAVLDWNHEITGEVADQIVFTLVENLEIENQAVRLHDASVLEAVDHGDRLEAMQAVVRDAAASGLTVVDHYQIETVHVTLLVPFGRQDGLSLGMESQGTAIRQTYDADGQLVDSTEVPFATTFVMRRATGDRWLNVAELPYEAA